jgi:hypothetical protein
MNAGIHILTLSFLLEKPKRNFSKGGGERGEREVRCVSVGENVFPVSFVDLAIEIL